MMRALHGTVACLMVIVFSSGAIQASSQQASGPANTQGAASGVSTKAAPVKVTYDHLNDNQNRIYTIEASRGDEFVVRILRTCLEDFEYGVQPVRRPPSPDSFRSAQLTALAPKDITITYDPQYSGYIINIRPKATGAPSTCYASDDPNAPAETKNKPAELNTTTLTIGVNEQKWNVSFSGAFTVAGLTNPVFALKTVEGHTDKQVVEEDKRDSATLGVASFIHVYHSRVPWVAPMFGLGITQDSRPSYYFGGGFRFSDRATFNGGLALGPITRLPNGLAIKDFTSDANALANLGTRIVPSWFIGISFSFIDVGDRFKKPFTEATDTKPADTKPADSKGQQAPQDGAKANAAKPNSQTSHAAAGEACIKALTPDLRTMEFDSDGKPIGLASSSIQVSAPDTCDWGIGLKAMAPWAHVRTSATSFDVTVQPNMSAERTEVIVVEGPKGVTVREITLTQRAKP